MALYIFALLACGVAYRHTNAYRRNISALFDGSHLSTHSMTLNGKNGNQQSLGNSTPGVAQLCQMDEMTDHVQFGVSLSFATSSGGCDLGECKPWNLIPQGVPEFIKFTASEHGGEPVCSCFCEDGRDEEAKPLFDFFVKGVRSTLKADVVEACSARICWEQYALARYMAKLVDETSLSMTNSLNRPDHWEGQCVDATIAANTCANIKPLWTLVEEMKLLGDEHARVATQIDGMIVGRNQIVDTLDVVEIDSLEDESQSMEQEPSPESLPTKEEASRDELQSTGDGPESVPTKKEASRDDSDELQSMEDGRLAESPKAKEEAPGDELQSMEPGRVSESAKTKEVKRRISDGSRGSGQFDAALANRIFHGMRPTVNKLFD